MLSSRDGSMPYNSLLRDCNHLENCPRTQFFCFCMGTLLVWILTLTVSRAVAIHSAKQYIEPLKTMLIPAARMENVMLEGWTLDCNMSWTVDLRLGSLLIFVASGAEAGNSLGFGEFRTQLNVGSQ